MADDADKSADFFGMQWKHMTDHDRMVWINARKSDLQRHLSGITDAMQGTVEKGTELMYFDGEVKRLNERLAFLRERIVAVRRHR